MTSLEINGISYPYEGIAVELASLDLIDWLSQQQHYPKVFWKARDQDVSYAALGALLEFDRPPRLAPTSLNVRLYGGMRFNKEQKTSAQWKNFPNAFFFLPHFEIIQEKGKTLLLVHHIGATSCLSQGSLTQTTEESELAYTERRESTCSHAWEQKVAAILKKIDAGNLEKVVLANEVRLECETTPSPWKLLERLQEKSTRATLFAFQLQEESAFFGATPEKLFERRGKELRVDAVAGTRKRGDSNQEDEEIAQELLKNPKELREFSIVKEFIASTLSPLAKKLLWEGEDRILKNSFVQHLFNSLFVELKEEISDRDLIDVLHPTPALGGFPKDAALECIEELEGFDRGWFGAPVGVISANSSCFVVAIRSGLIDQKQLYLYSGAGIVEGSCARNEWEELDQKLKPLLSLLTEHPMEAVDVG